MSKSRRARVTFADVLRIREFRTLFAAQVLSQVGDNLAKVAIAVIIFSKSHSPLLTGVSYGLSFLPWLIGGPVLSALADRFPRRRVMVVSDIVRAAVIALAAIPAIPISDLLVLITVVALLEPPFRAARSALMPQIVGEGEPFTVAMNLWGLSNTISTASGLAIGGAIVALIGARPAIGVDAATFVVSALLAQLLIAERPMARTSGHHITRDLLEGARFVFGEPWLLWLAAASAIAMSAIVAGLAAAIPLAAAHHSSTALYGVLSAAPTIGGIVGVVVIGRMLSPSLSKRLMLPLALLAPAVMLLVGFNPSISLTLAIFGIAGFCTAMSTLANGAFVSATPDGMRGRAFGIANAMVAGFQGVSTIATGLIADHVGPARAIAFVSLCCLILLVGLSVSTLQRQRGRAWGPKQATTDAVPDLGIVVVEPSGAVSPAGSAPLHSASPAFPIQSSHSLELPITSEPEGTDYEDSAMASNERQETRPRVWLLIWALIAAQVVVGITRPSEIFKAEPLVQIHLPIWWLFALFMVAIGLPLKFRARRNLSLIHIEAVPIVLGLFFASPEALLLTRVAAMALVVLLRRGSLDKFVFNVAAVAASTEVAVFVFHLMAPTNGVHPQSWPATFVAVLIESFTAQALVFAVIALAEGGGSRRLFSLSLVVDLLTSTTVTLLSLTIAAAVSYDKATAWTSTVFTLLVVITARTYHRLAERHSALDRLYGLARQLGPLTFDPADMGPALEQLRLLLHADFLELSLMNEDSGELSVITVSALADGGSTSVRIGTRQSTESDTWMLEPQSQPAVSGAIRRLWEGRTRPDRISTHVLIGDRPRGMIVARQEPSSERFESSEHRLLEAAASQLGVALERGRLVSSLRVAATRDSLTGLANLDSLRLFLSSTLEGGVGGVLLLLDIDRFHEVNDTLGHDAGDTVLVEVARRLESSPTQGALVARVGSDQFALAIPGKAGGEVARLAALAVKSRVDGSMRFDTVSADIRVTIGIARSPEHGVDASTLLRRGEMAMTAAKGTSAGIGEWEPSFEQDGSRRLQLLAGLRQALAEGTLKVEYQPKLRLGGGEVTGFEALVRWRHPDLGMVPPAEFVPLTEASGLISALTSHVLRTSLNMCKRWHDMGKPVGVAVNISARSLDDPVLVGQVAAMLTASGLGPQWLTLEITESSVMENHARSIEVLRQLRSLGVRLSIDDFGTGYSSLHQLRGLPVHEVKIDRSFVDTVDDGGVDRAVVRAIVDLCDSLGLTTVAEGVEKASQAFALETLGVPIVQGYFYGRPMAEQAATDWLASRPTLDPVSYPTV